MLLQKTLHLSQPVAECKASLANIQSYRRQFPMVTRATVTSSKTVDFSFRGPLGFEAHTVLLSVESDSPDQYAFESVGGNINLMGIVEFAEIRPSCTEVRSIRARENGTTGFRTWDALEGRAAATQIGTLNRWNKGEQTA